MKDTGAPVATGLADDLETSLPLSDTCFLGVKGGSWRRWTPLPIPILSSTALCPRGWEWEGPASPVMEGRSSPMLQGSELLLGPPSAFPSSLSEPGSES